MTDEEIVKHNKLQIESCLLDCINDCLLAGKILDGKIGMAAHWIMAWNEQHGKNCVEHFKRELKN